MKKIVFMKFLMLVLIGILVGCSNNSEIIEPDISVGVYVMEESVDVLKPYVVLKDNNEFSFTYSSYSSYLIVGSYKEDAGNLTLKTIDDEFKYVFKIKDNKLVFNEKESSEIPSVIVPDGSIFSFNKDYLAGREPFIGIGYNLEFKDKIFPNMTDLEITEAIYKITVAAGEKTRKGENFKITEEELEKLEITGLDPQYLNMIKISTD